MKKEQNLQFITDLVYNHAANDCSILKDHPEAAYNLVNSPHLKPAVLLDSILMQFTKDCQEGTLLPKGIPSHRLQLIRHYLLDEVLPSYRFWEFDIVDTDRLVEEFRQHLSTTSGECPEQGQWHRLDELQVEHGQYRRMRSGMNLELATSIFFSRHEGETNVDGVDPSVGGLVPRSSPSAQPSGVSTVERRSAPCGGPIVSPRAGTTSSRSTELVSPAIGFPSSPFVGNYFHYPNDEFLHPDKIDRLMQEDPHYQSDVMAHNGWLMH